MDVLAEAVPTEVPPTSSVLVSGLLKALHELDWSARRAISREKTKSTIKCLRLVGHTAALPAFTRNL